jgi:hypothetical protein
MINNKEMENVKKTMTFGLSISDRQAQKRLRKMERLLYRIERQSEKSILSLDELKDELSNITIKVMVEQENKKWWQIWK